MDQPLFATPDGAYHFDNNRKLYVHEHTINFQGKDTHVLEPISTFYVGSINPAAHPEFNQVTFVGHDVLPMRLPISRLHGEAILDEYISERLQSYNVAWLSCIPGFSNTFKKGHFPIGVPLRDRDNLQVSDGYLSLEAVTTRIQLGEKINEVYSQLPSNALPFAIPPPRAPPVRELQNEYRLAS